ncbi:hypothetical protein OQJ15_07525 [Fluoribacter dumoffii]|nr:hypothetical protein [Fluoribacter dumoffii]MCW8386151.1 hypothetical protein [Fluoribacter dumoffii]MCW8419202.1 hypothetical protein [Fluoribacter dumoffii]MCW8459827.1 hypothetical protein [Fluoribacter dumoffii]MCW8483304.1 hypothetical protein [Fluoribacter dumoffii]MCW8495555.1 hypothetical protein [Fluoribacter dumoffii]
MSHYLYIPFRKKEVPPNYKKIIEEWLSLEERQESKITVCYYGEKKLKQLPLNSKISVIFPGKPGKKSPLHGIEAVATETLRFFENLSLHLRVTDESKNSILIPEVADKMQEDGLLDAFDGRLQIKLIYLDANAKEASIMTSSFLNSLKKYKEHERGAIKLQFLSNNPTTNANLDQTHKTKKTKLESFREQAEQGRHCIYNLKEHYPKLSLGEVAHVIRDYYQYKSSRCCGLSGLLSLNWLFSSTESKEAINYLSNDQISDVDRFAYASRFLKRYKENHLTQILAPVLEKALIQHESNWETELHSRALQFEL